MTLDDQLVEDMRRELRLALRRLHNFPVNATVDADQLASVIGRVDGVFGGGVVDEPAPPLFAGEPERCSLCSEPGHTHDDHWLFQHEPVQRLQARIKELLDETFAVLTRAEEAEAERDELKKQLGVMHESDGRESRLGVTTSSLDLLRALAKDAEPGIMKDGLTEALRYYDLVRKAWEGTREDYDELERERDELKADLRKFVPSDGVMHQLLAFYEAIAEAATVFEALAAERMIDLDDVNRWLSLPAVVQVIVMKR